MTSVLVDFGNSALRWCTPGQLDQGEVGYLRHHGRDLPEILTAAWAGLEPPRSVWVASVAGAENDAVLQGWVQKQWHFEPSFCRVEAEAFGVRNGYRDPGQLGIDRWLVLIAARKRLRDPVLIVDCGTATTIDALQGDGRHLGGYIVPGLGTMRRALLDYTRIPRVEFKQVAAHPGDNTASAVSGGSLIALAGAITHAYAALEHDVGRRPALLLTGSEATMIMNLLDMPYQHVPHLVLEGVARFAREQG